MRLYSLDIPESQEELAGWLSGQVLSLSLPAFVAELSAIHSNGHHKAVSIDDVVGGDWQAVFAHGLDVLSYNRLVQFLRQPTLLLDLQARVLGEGGPFWSLPEGLGSGFAPQREAGWLRLRRAIDEEQWQSLSSENKFESPQAPRRPLLAIALVVVAVAMLAALIVLLVNRNSDDDQWGWMRRDAFARAATGQQYLDQLAELAQEWSDRRPVTQEELYERLSQFRQGCFALRKAKHATLSGGDYGWLIAESKRWAELLSEQMTALDDGADVLVVRDATDAIVEEIVEALRARAKKADSAGE